MKRALSSRFTVVHRFVVPGLMVGLGVFVLARITFQTPREHAPLYSLGLITILLGVATFLVQRRLKKVWIVDGVMFVSDYHRVAQVPLSEIENITEIDGYRLFPRTPNRQITIRLKRKCEFGREITFATRLELIKRPEGLELLEKLRSGIEI